MRANPFPGICPFHFYGICNEKELIRLYSWQATARFAIRFSWNILKVNDTKSV